jgi:GrpB-like predicted nucleotidyltransferase (UPF0157 family)
MSTEPQQSKARPPLTETEIRNVTIGEPVVLSAKINLVDYDPRWPELFEHEAGRIKSTLGSKALRIEHTGSTSVPGLVAKPIIDMLLVVADSARQDEYAPELQAGGYVLRIVEPDWHEHRMFKGPDTDVNLHVFSSGCSEIDRVLKFRDWLRGNESDRDLYARTKKLLAEKDWKYVQNYADAKSAVIEEIIERALQSGKQTR